MVKRIDATMSTEIALDLVKASNSVKSMTNLVKSATNAWKAQEAQLKSTGDYVEAAETKYNGLGEAIKRQESLIDSLKSKQSALKGNTTETANEYLKYQQQIDRATTKLDSMQAQQERAKSALDLQKSGILSLNNTIKAQTELMQATIQKQQALGDSQGASQSKIESLSNINSKYSEVLEKEKGILATVAENSGKSSDAYAKQATRVENLRTKIAENNNAIDEEKDKLSQQRSGVSSLAEAIQRETSIMQASIREQTANGDAAAASRTKIASLSSINSKYAEVLDKEELALSKIKSASGDAGDAYSKQAVKVAELRAKIAENNTAIDKERDILEKSVPSGFVDSVNSKLESVKGHLDSVQDKADKTSHIFGKIFGAQIAANAVTGALASIQAHFGSLINSAKEYDINLQKMKATWTTLTGSSTKANDMVKTINDLALKTGQATDTVDELEQKFYHLHSSKSESDELTKSMLNMSDAVGLNSEQIENVTQDMVNGLSRGKATAGTLNQISQYFPMFREQLAKYETQVNHGKTVTVSDLTQMAKQGKISAKDIETVFNQLGSGKYDKAAENMLQTMYGMDRTIKSQMPKLVGDIYQPIMTMKNPLIGQVSKWTTSSDAQKAFKGVGQALSMQISDIMNAFSGKKLNISDSLNGGLLKLQTGIDKLGASIVAHKSDIKDFVGSVKTGAATSWKVFVDVLKDLEPVMKLVGELAEKYPSQFASVISLGILANKAITPLTLSFKLLSGTWKTLSFPYTAFKAITTEGTISNKVVSVLGSSFSKMGSWAKSGATKVGSAVSSMGSSIANFSRAAGSKLKLTASVATSKAKTAITGLWNVTKSTGKLIGKGLKFTASVATKAAQLALTGLLKAAKLTATGLKVAFNFLKANPFILLVSAIAAVVAGFVELYKHNAKFRAFVNNLVKSAQQFFKGVTKWFSQTWNNIKKGASSSWNSTKKFFSDGWNNTVKATQSGYKSITKWFGNLWNDTKKGASSSWNNTKNAFSSGWNSTIKTTQNGYKSTTRWFSDLWSDTKKGVQNSWNDTKNKFNAGWNDTKKLTQSGANWVGNRWNQLKTDTGKIANDMKNSHNTTFKTGYKTLEDYTQTFHDITTGKWGKVGGDIKNTVNDLFRTVKSAFSGAYNWLNNLTGGRLGDILSTFSSIFGKIVGVVKDAFKGIHDGFVDIVRGIIKPFNSMLSGLEKGINWVLDKVGASKIKGDWSVPLPGYAVGTQGGILHNQIARVNDGTGSNYREMYATPDGKIGMFPAQRNMIVPLQKGTEILDGENSAKLASMLGINSYATGAVGKFFSGIFNKGKDLLEDADKIIAHPIDFLESVFSRFASNISAGAGIATDIITNFPSTVAKSAASWIKKLFNDAGGSSANPGGSGVQRWRGDVIKALRANGLSTSAAMVAKVLRQIQTESGGNPNARQPGADPDGDGSGPALGLMQTKRSTFNAYKFKGHGELFNGYDDLLAGLAYAKARYGKSLSFLGNGHGYANGGIVSSEGLYHIAEKNKPEAIIPLDAMKTSRAWELIGKAAAVVAKNDSTSLQSNNSVGNDKADKLLTKLETMIDSIGKLSDSFVKAASRPTQLNINSRTVAETIAPDLDKIEYNRLSALQRNSYSGSVYRA